VTRFQRAGKENKQRVKDVFEYQSEERLKNDKFLRGI